MHHGGEEEILFPQIEAMSGEAGIMEKNVEQHHGFHDGLEKFKEYTTSCLRSKDAAAFDGRELVAIIDSFGHALATHLKEEIDTLLGLQRYGDKMAEFEHKFEQWSNKDTVKSPTWTSAPVRSGNY